MVELIDVAPDSFGNACYEIIRFLPINFIKINLTAHHT